MADIFISYTSQDRDWAFWIGQELEKLGHTPRIHEWEISGGGDIAAWMDERCDKADHALLVISETYLGKPYSSWERRSAQWAAQTDRPNFALPVRIELCKLPNLLASVKRSDLFGVDESEARERLIDLLRPADKPAVPTKFPGAAKPQMDLKPEVSAPFPGQKAERRSVITNIPINVPRHFIGRHDDFRAIEIALNGDDGRAVVTALHGLRGVGKTTLAAAYAERHRDGYRATWWIRAATPATMRADIAGLGVRLGWIAADTQEEQAVNTVLDQLRSERECMLLIYDNAVGPRELTKYLPRGGSAHIIITSNAPNWGAVAAPMEVDIWSDEVGADFLMVRTQRMTERDAALALSRSLGGLPLAHEQAAAYCERTGSSFAGYNSQFESTPVALLGEVEDLALDYGVTVARTFALAIAGAIELHPHAFSLMVLVALLSPRPIPMYFFSEGHEKLGEDFASVVKKGDLDRVIAALRGFALLDRELIFDERDPSVVTDCISVHRLVGQITLARFSPEFRQRIGWFLIEAIAEVYPPGSLFAKPELWPRARRLDAIASALVGIETSAPVDVAEQYWRRIVTASRITTLNQLALYRQTVLGDFAEARRYFELALAINERDLDSESPFEGIVLNNLGGLHLQQGSFGEARSCYERAALFYEKKPEEGPTRLAITLSNLSSALTSQGEHVAAKSLQERSLAILGEDANDPNTTFALSQLGYSQWMQGNLTIALTYFERAVAICEKGFGPDHLYLAANLANLGGVVMDQGDLVRARSLLERALALRQATLGSDHIDTAMSLNDFGCLLRREGDHAAALPYHEQALAIFVEKLGPTHPNSKKAAENVAVVLEAIGRPAEARSLRDKFGL